MFGECFGDIDASMSELGMATPQSFPPSFAVVSNISGSNESPCISRSQPTIKRSSDLTLGLFMADQDPIGTARSHPPANPLGMIPDQQNLLGHHHHATLDEFTRSVVMANLDAVKAPPASLVRSSPAIPISGHRFHVANSVTDRHHHRQPVALGSLPNDPLPSPVFPPHPLIMPSPLVGGARFYQSQDDNRAFAYRSGVPPVVQTPSRNPSLSDSMFSFKTNSAGGPSETMDQVLEKQRRRKENHNAVERRRRDHINEMIQRLSQLVGSSSTGSISGSSSSSSLLASIGLAGSPPVKLNKGEVLERAVDRIVRLSQIVEMQCRRLAEIDPSWRLPDIYDDILAASTVGEVNCQL